MTTPSGNLERSLEKFIGYRCVSLQGGEFVFMGLESFRHLGSVREAEQLYALLGVKTSVVFRERLLFFRGRLGREVKVYLTVRNGSLVYAGLCPEEAEETLLLAEPTGAEGGATMSMSSSVSGSGKWWQTALLVIVVLGAGIWGSGIWQQFLSVNEPYMLPGMVDSLWQRLDKEQQEQVLALLSRAQAALLVGDYWQSDSSAYSCYLNILKLHSSNRIALQQLKQLQAFYRDIWAKRFMQNKLDSLELQLAYAGRVLGGLDSVKYSRMLDSLRYQLEKEKQLAIAVYKTIEWVRVEGGNFQMGCTQEQGNDCDDDEHPVHKVYLDSFYMSKYEVTNAQFVIFLNAIKSKITIKDNEHVYYRNNEIYDLKCSGCKNWEDKIIFDGFQFKVKSGYENHPVSMITWYGAMAFCKWVSKHSGFQIRLPTEAEWEYAARGGQKSKGYIYSGTSDLNELYKYANYADQNTNYEWSDSIHNDGYRYTSPIGSYKANELGLYDMSGNVWEFCFDWYSNTYYEMAPINNPTGPEKGELRVRRGGSWQSNYMNLRVSNRYFIKWNDTSPALGFRILMKR